jgi:hypothetical protein
MMDSQRGRLLKALRMFRTWLTLLVAVFVVASGMMVWEASAQRGSNSRNDYDWDDNDRDHHKESYAIGLWGDMPYSDTQAKDGVPSLIRDMNEQKLAFTVHDGDLKAGNGVAGSATPTTCADAMYVQALGFLNALNAPAAFTPGDNDWTDCDRASNGGFNSLERLDHERQLFFSTPFTFGIHRLRQAVQSDTTETPCQGYVSGGLDTITYKLVACVENRRWTYRGVTYATLNIQGSCDNRCGDHPDTKEADSRRDADIAWMREAFQLAKDRGSAAIMFISQADPGFHNRPVESEPTRNPKTLELVTPIPAGIVDGHRDFLLALRDEVKAFRKPVAYVHGDTHYFRIDKPFYDSDPPDSVTTTARRLENFIRIETFGDNTFTGANTHPDPDDNNNVHWVKVFVDPDSRDVFAFQAQIVPSNRPVVPAP